METGFGSGKPWPLVYAPTPVFISVKKWLRAERGARGKGLKYLFGKLLRKLPGSGDAKVVVGIFVPVADPQPADRVADPDTTTVTREVYATGGDITVKTITGVLYSEKYALGYFRNCRWHLVFGR
jgi:hypothetical protein